MCCVSVGDRRVGDGSNKKEKRLPLPIYNVFGLWGRYTVKYSLMETVLEWCGVKPECCVCTRDHGEEVENGQCCISKSNLQCVLGL